MVEKHGTNEGSPRGGRFIGGPSRAMTALSKSTHFDWVLAPYDVLASKTRAWVLHAHGLLSDADSGTMTEGLNQLDRDVVSSEFGSKSTNEDVYDAMGRGLTGCVGPEVGGRLRVGHSRSSQAATLFRMWLHDVVCGVALGVMDLVGAPVARSKAHPNATMPGKIHSRAVQPVLLVRQLPTRAYSLLRDLDRICDLDRRLVASPYSSSALARPSLHLGPETIIKELGFDPVTDDSIGDTSSRGFASEAAFASAQITVDMSRLTEEIIYWVIPEYGYVTLAGAWPTGSSIMP